MVFIISLLAAMLITLMKEQLLKHENVFYCISIAISVSVVFLTWNNVMFQGAFAELIYPVFSRGGLSGALFIVVMLTGALPNGTKMMKRLYPIRKQLSIMACILAFGHNAAYGRTYFKALFLEPESLPFTQLLAAVCSLVMLIIMIPLFITSFNIVRRKMSAKSWKKLQRFAYVFYGLLCAHIMLLTVPNAIKLRPGYVLTVCVYGAIFIGYFICRVMKIVKIKKRTASDLAKKERMVSAVCAITAAFGVFMFNGVGQQEVRASSVDSGEYTDGVYTGKAFGNCSDISVEVTVEKDEIKSIEIISHGEDEPYISDAMHVIDEMLVNNSTEVDAVSGATYSSEGIIDAVKVALTEAQNSPEG